MFLREYLTIDLRTILGLVTSNQPTGSGIVQQCSKRVSFSLNGLSPHKCLDTPPQQC